jgi:hypothetical protein
VIAHLPARSSEVPSPSLPSVAFLQLPPLEVLIAWDSVTVTATSAAGPAWIPKFPPPGAPAAVHVTDQ